ncbi:MAG: DNA repair protein RecN [Candidatus Cloacimonetes bacterium 4572_65]|nr:MAG: DNA repair protein RecN [Candidatus Cloacimonetes bacterium 4572_65]
MIRKIKFRNFVLIKELELEFENGMNVITGETGAGKSVLVGGLNLVLGSVARGHYYYDKEKSIYLEVQFEIDRDNEDLISLLGKHNIDITDGDLFFVREISVAGKSANYINGRRVTSSIVKEFRSVLLDFHSQNEQLNLTNGDYQLMLLDSFGELDQLRDDYFEKFDLYRENLKMLKDLKRKEKAQVEKIQLYEYQVEELDALNLRFGEDQELDRQYSILINAEEIVSSSNRVIQDFYDGESSLTDSLRVGISRIEKFKSEVHQIGASVEYLQDGLALIEDGINQLRDVEDVVVVDSEKLKIVEDRIRAIEDIKSKYRVNSIQMLIEYYDEINDFLLHQSSLSEEITKRIASLEKEKSKVLQLAKKLTSKRKNRAKLLEIELQKSIKYLALAEAKARFVFEEREDSNIIKGLSDSGADVITLLFSANRGIELQPLKDAASGGELSRMLLAFKKIIADKIAQRTVIFDEIDVGIGGNTALHIADFISNIGDKHQVLCITHLPQVGAKGDTHFKIDKVFSGKKTEIKITKLSSTEREIEIARMLSGLTSETSIKHAKEILNK